MANLIMPSAKLISITSDPGNLIELSARTCYNSRDRMKEKRSDYFLQSLIASGHESVIEHASASFEIVCSRSTSHQIVRHRLFSYSQRSQRYVSESDFAYILPDAISNKLFMPLHDHMLSVQEKYKNMINSGVKREDARCILPNACATTLVMTGNFRNWRHFIKLRSSKHAQAEIRSIALDILDILSAKSHACFNDLKGLENECN